MTQPSATPVVPAPAPRGGAMSAPPPEVPPDVTKFAEEHGVSAYLPPLLALMGRIVPDRPIQVRLDCDPEIAGDWYITLLVDVGGMTADELVAAHNLWVKGLLTHCPSTHTHFFHFGMV